MTALFSIVEGWNLIEMTRYEKVADANKRVTDELRGGFDRRRRGTQMCMTIYDGKRPVSSKEWIASGLAR